VLSCSIHKRNGIAFTCHSPLLLLAVLQRILCERNLILFLLPWTAIIGIFLYLKTITITTSLPARLFGLQAFASNLAMFPAMICKTFYSLRPAPLSSIWSFSISMERRFAFSCWSSLPMHISEKIRNNNSGSSGFWFFLFRAFSFAIDFSMYQLLISSNVYCLPPSA